MRTTEIKIIIDHEFGAAFDDALDEAVKKIKDDNITGHNGNKDSSYWFDVRTTDAAENNE